MNDDCRVGVTAKTDADKDLTDRRDVLIGGSAALVSAGVPSLAGAADKPPEKLFTQAGDRLQIIKGELKDQFLRPEHLTPGERPVEAFPFSVADDIIRRKNRLNRILVLRLDSAEMDEDTRSKSVEGVLAYSALCTHRACTIKSWMADERYLRCHCHLSTFAALSEGSVKSGPAKRQLPMVPLGLDDEGFVIATDGFTRKPGAAKK